MLMSPNIAAAATFLLVAVEQAIPSDAKDGSELPA